MYESGKESKLTSVCLRVCVCVYGNEEVCSQSSVPLCFVVVLDLGSSCFIGYSYC